MPLCSGNHGESSLICCKSSRSDFDPKQEKDVTEVAVNPPDLLRRLLSQLNKKMVSQMGGETSREPAEMPQAPSSQSFYDSW